jgi:hypothetical protein
MDATRHALSGVLLALAVPVGVLVGVLLGLLLAVWYYLRVLWALGKLLGRGAGWVANLRARPRWPLDDRSAAPSLLALPPRR